MTVTITKHSAKSTMTAAQAAPDARYCERLPKIELHAHLTGSVTRDCLQSIWEERTAREGELGIEAPATALADATVGQSIGTFFSHFNKYIYHLVSTPAALAFATRSVLEHFQSDGVAYLELRTTPRGLGTGSPEAAIRVILDVIRAWNGVESMRVNLILSVDRARHGLSAAVEIVELALHLKDTGEPVVGVDLCGDPNAASDVTELRRAFSRAREGGLQCVLHFAEVPASSSERELAELLSWQPARLGHVIHVPIPTREKILSAGIAPELCLSCNVLAGMLPGTPSGEAAGLIDHHFGWWWARGGSLSLGTDDVGVFRSRSSEEHLHAATHFGLSNVDLIELGRRAMMGALCAEGDKASVLALLDEFERSILEA